VALNVRHLETLLASFISILKMIGPFSKTVLLAEALVDNSMGFVARARMRLKMRYALT
jgi:hypothetical protein